MLVGERMRTTNVVENGKFKLSFAKGTNAGGWHNCAWNFLHVPDVTFGEAQTVTVPYKYISTGGAKGTKFMLIVGSDTKKTYFGIQSANTVSNSGEWESLTFNLAEVHATYPTAFTAVKNEQITFMRLHPYAGATEMTTGSSVDAHGTQKINWPDVISLGTCTCSWPESVVYTASFNANGGETVADMQTDDSGTLTLPTTTREGYTLVGWYRNGMCYLAGSEVLLTSDSSYVAAWKKTDPTCGLHSSTFDYRKELDIFEAYGSCCNLLVGESGRYDPLTDIYRAYRVGIVEVDAEPTVRGSATNVLLSGKLPESKGSNNSLYLNLPVVGLKVSDVYTVKLRYRAIGSNVVGKPMKIGYEVGKSSYAVVSENTMQCSTGDEFRTMKFNFAESLGTATYEKISNSVIKAWRLYPYKDMPIPVVTGVTIELGRMLLDRKYANGLILVVR